MNLKKSGRSAVPAFVIVLLCFCLHGIPSHVMARTLDQVVATVNENVITMSELDEAVGIYLHQLSQMQNRPSISDQEKKALERRVLEELIDKKLKEDYALEMGIGASEEEIKRAIEDVLSRANISEVELQQALDKDGIRYEEYRDQIRNQIIKAKLIHREISNRIDIKDAEIEGYYLDHPEEFQTKEGFEIRHILLPLPPKPTPEKIEETSKEALRIRREILDGMPFEDASLKYSGDATAARGGRLGFFRKGDLNPEMERAVSALNEGEMSEPIRSPLGIHLIRLEEKTSGESRALEKVKEMIREKLYEVSAERKFEDWRMNLRKNAHIEVFL